KQIERAAETLPQAVFEAEVALLRYGAELTGNQQLIERYSRDDLDFEPILAQMRKRQSTFAILNEVREYAENIENRGMTLMEEWQAVLVSLSLAADSLQTSAANSAAALAIETMQTVITKFSDIVSLL